MTGLTDWLLTALLNHGSVLLGGSLFLAAAGVPLPATLLLLAAGAFTRQGVLDAEPMLLAAVAGAIGGDALSYGIGRFALRLAPAALLASAGWQRAADLFARWGGWGVLLTRFALTPAALPINLLAGSTRYGWGRFMAAVVVGEVVWVLLFAGLGRLFADQWETLGHLATDVVGLLMGLAVAAAGAVALLRRRTP